MKFSKLRVEILNFEFFKNSIISPENYVDASMEMYERGYPAEICPPYFLVYNTFRRICKEQRGIVENREDTTMLSAAFSQLPKLTELCLCFCQTVAEEVWVGLHMDTTMTAKEKTLEHHFQVILNSLKAGRNHGTFIHTVHLSGLELPHYCSRQSLEAQVLRGYLYDLLVCAQTLRLSGSGTSLESLSHTTLRLRQLDLCRLTVPYTSLHEFLQRNAGSIESIRVHNVELVSNIPSDVGALEVSLKKLGSSWHFTHEERSPCTICWEEGWRLSKRKEYNPQ